MILERKDATQFVLAQRGALYLILQNRLYRGEIPHKGNAYPGEHPAIVDKPLWDDVQAVLAGNRVERATGARASHPSLLTGMVFDESGERLTPTYAVKKGTRYRYYVSTSLITGAGRNRSSGCIGVCVASITTNEPMATHSVPRARSIRAQRIRF